MPFLTSKTFPGFYGFLSEGRKLQGMWGDTVGRHELHLGAPGATAANVPTIMKVNSKSESGVTGIKNPSSLNIGNYKESLLDGETQETTFCTILPLVLQVFPTGEKRSEG